MTPITQGIDDYVDELIPPVDGRRPLSTRVRWYYTGYTGYATKQVSKYYIKKEEWKREIMP